MLFLLQNAIKHNDNLRCGGNYHDGLEKNK